MDEAESRDREAPDTAGTPPAAPPHDGRTVPPPPAPRHLPAQRPASARSGARRRKPRAKAPPHRRWLMLAVGWALVAFGLIIGPLPGPGAVIFVPLGLALILRNSFWAKRVYSRVKHRHDDLGRWADWALGRRHHQHRRPDLPSLRSLVFRLIKGGSGS